MASVPALRALPPFVAMTAAVAGWLPASAPAAPCGRSVRAAFRLVEARLTRFDPHSELNRLCAAGGGTASPVLFRALTTAARAWRRTGGRFDPRVRADLEALGYGRRLRFGTRRPRVALTARALQLRARRPFDPAAPWLAVAWPVGSARQPRAALQRPGVRAAIRRPHRLRLWGGPLDLGGIGKGLALRGAVRALRSRLDRAERRLPQGRSFGPCGPGRTVAPGFLLDAGGDIYAEGPGPDGGGWPIGVAGPGGAAVAVLRVAGRAVCTSSRGRRAWDAGGERVHHLIDPKSGLPAGGGLWSVTVVGRDPAWAEVWSKALFVAGPAAPALAEARGLAALLVLADGRVVASARGQTYLRG